MQMLTRRNLIQSGVALAGAAAAAPIVARTARAEGEAADCAVSGEPHTTLTSANAPHAPVKVIDTDSMPWPPAEGDLAWKFKTLFHNEETGDHLVLIDIPIGGPGSTNHYHDFHEWAYWLSGDFVNNEYTSPYQRVGPFQQFREGTFLDRPAYSLHGGEPGRLDSQVGGVCLIMEEGGETHGVIPGGHRYNEDFKKVKQWAVPRIIETLSEMPWEPDAANPSNEGVLVKRLVDDQVRGFRATLWRIAHGWKSSQAPEFARAHYYKKAHQFNFVLNGDMRLQAFSAPDSKAEIVHLGKSFYFERAPMSIFGLADGVVSDEGCVWLEVTYGKGSSIPNTPIEEPTYV